MPPLQSKSSILATLRKLSPSPDFLKLPPWSATEWVGIKKSHRGYFWSMELEKVILKGYWTGEEVHFVLRPKTYPEYTLGDVPLVSGGLNFLTQDSSARWIRDEGFYLVKYDAQPRGPVLKNMTRDKAIDICQRTGLDTYLVRPRIRPHFLATEAGVAFTRWVLAHPVIAGPIAHSMLAAYYAASKKQNVELAAVA